MQMFVVVGHERGATPQVTPVMADSLELARDVTRDHEWEDVCIFSIVDFVSAIQAVSKWNRTGKAEYVVWQKSGCRYATYENQVMHVLDTFTVDDMLAELVDRSIAVVCRPQDVDFAVGEGRANLVGLLEYADKIAGKGKK